PTAVRAGDVILLGEVMLLVQGATAAEAAATETELIADDLATRELLMMADRAARADVPVLVVGATGAGKTLIAERIHSRSARAQMPLVRASAAALAHVEGERELMGDEGAPGLVERADRGTLLIEGVDELPAPLQGRLLRLIEAHEFTRVDVGTPRN